MPRNFRGGRRRKVMGRRWIVAVVAVSMILLASSGVAVAQPEVVTLSNPIELKADPTSIPADGVSTSNITIAVFWPELEELGNLSGTPAANTRVDVRTTLGKLTDAKNTSNSGKDITVYTGSNGIAVANVLLSGNEAGIANITARALDIEGVVNQILANNTTTYVVRNSTAVRFVEPVEPIECGWRYYLKEGKDYISLPAIPAAAAPDAVFGADVEVKGYNTTTGWYTPTVLEPRTGYLIRCAERKVVDVHGVNIPSVPWGEIKRGLATGWNLIGPGDKDVEITSCDLLVIGWDAVDDRWITLHKGDMLYGGHGYWIWKE